MMMRLFALLAAFAAAAFAGSVGGTIVDARGGKVKTGNLEFG